MRITKALVAAGLALSAMTMGAGIAQARDHHDRYDHGRYDHHRYERHDRYDRYDRGRHYGWDRGRYYGWRDHHRRCWVEWRYHRRVTVCS